VANWSAAGNVSNRRRAAQGWERSSTRIRCAGNRHHAATSLRLDQVRQRGRGVAPGSLDLAPSASDRARPWNPGRWEWAASRCGRGLLTLTPRGGALDDTAQIQAASTVAHPAGGELAAGTFYHQTAATSADQQGDNLRGTGQTDETLAKTTRQAIPGGRRAKPRRS